MEFNETTKEDNLKPTHDLEHPRRVLSNEKLTTKLCISGSIDYESMPTAALTTIKLDPDGQLIEC